MIRNFYVFTNFATSLDGKIASHERESPTLGSKYDRLLMDYHRSRAWAVLHGASTLRAAPYPVRVDKPVFKLKRVLQRMPIHPLNIVVTQSANLDPSWKYFKDPDVSRLIVVPKKVKKSQLKPFEGLAEVFRYSKQDAFADELIDYLHERGCKNLLIEGGGATIWPFVQDDLVDEWNITLTPKIVGGVDAPTMVEGPGFTADEIETYKLKSCRRVKDELYLQYLRR